LERFFEGNKKGIFFFHWRGGNSGVAEEEKKSEEPEVEEEDLKTIHRLLKELTAEADNLR
jgi:hypothetical protein